MKALLIVLIVGLAAPVVADPEPSPPTGAEPVPTPIKDTFGFDWMKPKRSKCVKVSGALLTRLKKSYACTPPDDPKASASGKVIIATCQAKKGKSEYLLLATKAECDEERETQLANGD